MLGTATGDAEEVLSVSPGCDGARLRLRARRLAAGSDYQPWCVDCSSWIVPLRHQHNVVCSPVCCGSKVACQSLGPRKHGGAIVGVDVKVWLASPSVFRAVFLQTHCLRQVCPTIGGCVAGQKVKLPLEYCDDRVRILCADALAISPNVLADCVQVGGPLHSLHVLQSVCVVIVSDACRSSEGRGLFRV